MLFIPVAIFIVVLMLRYMMSEERAVSGPLVERNAVAVTKRMQVRGGEHTSMVYYITFETEDGSRTEYSVSDGAYGEIAEGDRGVLGTKGSRFCSFMRNESRYSAEDPDKAAHRCPACGATYVGRVCEYCDTPWVDNCDI